MKNENSKLILAGITLLATLLLIVLLKLVDVAAVGEYSSVVGLSHFNETIMRILPYNEFWHKISNIFGYLMIGGSLLLGLILFILAIKNDGIHSIFKKNSALIVTFVAYVIMVAVYVFFDKVVINCRPVLLPDELELESSFPSSHTMFAVVLAGVNILLTGKQIQTKPVRLGLQIAYAVLMAFVVCGRTLAGVHWATDILGGILISVTIVLLYSFVLGKIKTE